MRGTFFGQEHTMLKNLSGWAPRQSLPQQYTAPSSAAAHVLRQLAERFTKRGFRGKLPVEGAAASGRAGVQQSAVPTSTSADTNLNVFEPYPRALSSFCIRSADVRGQ